MDELLQLPACTNERISSLRYLLDKLTIHVRGSESIGVSAEHYGSLLIPIIMSKLPNEIRLQAARKTTDQVWKIEEVLQILFKQTNNNVIANLDTPVLVIKCKISVCRQCKNKCAYCKNNHYFASCNELTDVNDC